MTLLFVILTLQIIYLHADDAPIPNIPWENAEIIKIPSSGQPIIFYNNNHLHQTNTSVTETTQVNQNPVQNQPENPADNKGTARFSNILEYFKNHPYSCLGASVIIGYGISLARLIWLFVTINQRNLWSMWKSDVPIEVLYEMPKDEIARELITAVNERYCAENEAQTSSALVKFLTDISEERTYLSYFIAFHERIRKYGLSFCFPDQQHPVIQARERIGRLDFLQALIIDRIIRKNRVHLLRCIRIR